MKVAKRCLLTLFETMFWRLVLLRIVWRLGRVVLHSYAIWKDLLEIETAEKMLISRTLNSRTLKRCFMSSKVLRKTEKTRTLNGAFWHNLKRYFGSWNCWEKFKIKVAKWCLLTLFKTMFLKLEVLKKIIDAFFYAIWNDVM